MFRAAVLRTLLTHWDTTRQLQASWRQDTSHPDYFEPACEGMLSGKAIPFIGMGIYGTGALSSAALCRALLGDEPVQEHSLATIAEYREKVMDSREEFLDWFRRILEEQSSKAEPEAIHDLMVPTAGPACDRGCHVRLPAGTPAGRRWQTLRRPQPCHPLGR